MKKTILTLAFGMAPWFTHAQKPGPSLLDPTNHTLVLIDHQGQMAFSVHSISVTDLRNSTQRLPGIRFIS